MWDRIARLIDPRTVVVAMASLAGATLLTAALENIIGVPNAASVYLVAVVAVALASGLRAAIVVAVVSVLTYDFLFTRPYFTLTIDDPGEWLSVLLLLFVGIVVGQLAALQRLRAEQALAREREARAMFQVTRGLATRSTTADVLPEIAGVLMPNGGMERVWITLGAERQEHAAADSGHGPLPATRIQSVLRRMPGDTPAEWVRVHEPARKDTPGTAAVPQSRARIFRVKISVGERYLGSIWGVRSDRAGEPDRAERRLLAAAADQIGQAIAQDSLAQEAQAAEVARLSDALKSSLLQAVSHDLRTPLATIRAAAGTLRPDTALGAAERLESAEAIEREVEYLDRLVTNLLDLGRIEAGALRPDVDAFEIEDLVDRTVSRVRARLGGRLLALDLGGAPVEVDPVFVEEALVNALDNAIRYTPAGAIIRLRSADLDDRRYVRLTIEDGGPGVPDEVLPRIFDRFFRAPTAGAASRIGTGIGLAVVRGLIEATGGRAAARRSELGGLAIDLDLPRATLPAALADASGSAP
jgi:two-component system sensor histidine kinase KdpD